MEKWLKKQITIGSALILFLFCVSGCANSAGKSPYDLFQWGTGQEDISDKLASSGIDFDYDVYEKTITYIESDFCGIQNSDGLVRFYYSRIRT